MGVRRKGPYVIWRCTIPTHIAAEIELSLADPLRNKPVYGGRSQLVTQLLIEYLEKLKSQAEEEKARATAS